MLVAEPVAQQEPSGVGDHSLFQQTSEDPVSVGMSAVMERVHGDLDECRILGSREMLFGPHEVGVLDGRDIRRLEDALEGRPFEGTLVRPE